MTSVMGSHSYCCKNVALDARTITKSHGYHFNLASHEAVAVILSEQHQNEINMIARAAHCF